MNTMGGFKCICGEVGSEASCTGNMTETSYFYGMIELNSTFKFNNKLLNTSSSDFTDMAQFIGDELSTYFGQNTGFNMTATVFGFMNGSELITAQYVVDIEGQGHKIVSTGMLLSSFFASMSMRNLSRDGFTFGGFPFKLKRIGWVDVRMLLPKEDSYDKEEDVFKIKFSSYIQLNTALSQRYNKLGGNILK
uniref:SEA domain-containing protein n=2 Tax=Ciona intestinalis TaxID=7719 RepID=F7AZL8_CIOIN